MELYRHGYIEIFDATKDNNDIESAGVGWSAVNHSNYPHGFEKKKTIIQLRSEKEEIDDDGELATIIREYVIHYTTLQNYYDEIVPSGEILKAEEEITVYVTKYKQGDETNQTVNKYNIEYNKQEGDALSTETVVIKSTADQLKGVVSKWYFILRNIALLVLMLVLIYTGIRIVIGSTAGQKAKYKERLMDWLVAMCLLFIMHYIMVFAVELVAKITELVDSVDTESGSLLYVPLKDQHISVINEMGENESTPEYRAFKTFGNVVGKELAWTTGIMGKMRIMAQTVKEGTANWVGYALCYIVLVIYTVFFTWTYLKRVLYMAFLTIIAPLVAMTYPIDKINDGKAQAFSAWLKEYIFNLLIQPMHLLLYTILVSSAYKLAATNPFYAIVAIGFMMPAEKLVRKFFGFSKAKTPGALGGAAGAALAFSGMQRLMKFGNHKDGKDKNKKEKDKIKWASNDGVNSKETVAKGILNKNGKNTNVPATDGTNEKSAPKPNNIETRGTNPPVQPGMGTPDMGEVPKSGGTDAPAPEVPGEPKKQNASGGVNKDSTGAKAINPQTMSSKVANYIPRESKRKKIGRAIKAGGKKYARLLGKKMANRIEEARPIRAIARGIGGLTGAATFGMAGLALGIASGDASKAFQYATAGVTGGYNAGKGVAGMAMNAVSVDPQKVLDGMEMTYYGEDYKKVKFEESFQKMANDPNNIKEIRQYMPELSYEEAQAVLTGDAGRECFKSGITDMRDIAAVHKMSQTTDATVEEGIAALKFNSYLPSDLKSLGAEEREDHIKQWTNEYEEMKNEDPEKYRDLDPEAAAKRSMELAEQINKIKSGLKDA